MIRAKLLAVTSAMLIAGVYPQISSAEALTGAKVLEWKKASQDSLFQDSVAMISIVASQTGRHGKIAECLDRWYFISEDVQSNRNDEIRAAVKRFPESHPQVIVLAVVQKECGKFGDS